MFKDYLTFCNELERRILEEKRTDTCLYGPDADLGFQVSLDILTELKAEIAFDEKDEHQQALTLVLQALNRCKMQKAGIAPDRDFLENVA